MTAVYAHVSAVDEVLEADSAGDRRRLTCGLTQSCEAPFVPEMEDAFDASNFQEFSGSDDEEEETQPYDDDQGPFEGF